MAYFVYILYSASRDRYYVGSTENPENRLQLHNGGRNSSTKSGVPWELKHTETFAIRSEAQTRELEIKKKKSRKYLEWVIGSGS